MGKTVAAIVGVVAAVAIAVVAPYLAPIALGALGITATATAIAVATAIIGAVLSIGLSLAFRAIGVGKPPSAKDAIGPPQVFRQSISNSFIIYGKRRVGGLLVFFHPRQSGSDHYRYFVIAAAGHRSKGVVTWMLGDEAVSVDGSGMVTSGKYANAAWLWFQRGLASETANSTFVAECGGKWTSSHKGNGITAIYAKFKMTDAVIQAGMPNITATVEGRDEVLDTRDATLKYTRNAILITYDWMSMSREEGGFGAYADEIPDNAYINAQANVCDEVIDGEARYAFDAILTTGAAPSEVRDAFVVNMAGMCAFSGGKHLIRPGYWVPVSVVLSEDDLAGPIQVSPFLTSDSAANEVQGTYVNPADNYQAAPLKTQSIASADIRQLEIDLAFTTSFNQGNRVLKIMLNRANCEKTVIWPMNIMGLGVEGMDTVQFDTTRYGLSNYAFVASNWALSADWGVVIQGREENADIYDDPSPATPATPPTIDVAPPIGTTTEASQLIATSSVTGLSFSVDTSGVFNISNHFRVYADKSVSVTGNSSFSSGGASGDIALIYYDDPARAGGAVTYHALVLAGGVGDVSGAYPSPTNPYRHYVCGATVPASGTTGGGSGAGSGGGTGGGGGIGGGPGIGDLP